MRVIRCKRCQKYLGEIRDARLRKGIIYYCDKCAPNANSAEVPEFLKGIFR